MKDDKYRTDFMHKGTRKTSDTVEIERISEDGTFYDIITFPRLLPKKDLEMTLKKEISLFVSHKKIKKPYHLFVVGIGNDSHTADSVGPKTLKHLHVNFHLQKLGLTVEGNVLSSLEPGVLGETGIATERIVESVVEEIHPDCIIFIDSFVTCDVDDIGKTIILTDEGLVPGGGLKGTNGLINEDTLGVPTLTIGVPVALEVKLSSSKKDSPLNYLLSPSDIDVYVDEISRIIATSINSSTFD